MTKPWWQLVLDGEASPSVDRPAPEFTGLLGVTPAGWEPGGIVRFNWEPPPFTRTPGGWVQGGFLGVVLDMTQTFAVFTQIPERAMPMTLEMKVSFIAASYASRYVVTGRPVRVGTHAAHTEGTIHDEDGKLIATSTSTHVIRRP